MKKFLFYSPTKIYFGPDVLENDLSLLKQYGAKALIVTYAKQGKFIKDLLKKVMKKLQQLNIKIERFDGISANPKTDEINNCVNLMQAKQLEMVIAVGGGSVIDAAKSIAACIGEKKTADQYLYGGSVPHVKTLPIITIPTLAGSGAEVTKAAIITDSQRGIKTGIRSEFLFPKLALVDPEYNLGAPLKIRLEAGFDVLTHAFETYVANKATLFSEKLSELAMEIIATDLPQIIKEPHNTKSCHSISLASTLMGINLANVGTCLPHRIQYAISSDTSASHGAGLAALYQSWIDNTYAFSPGKFNKAAEILKRHQVSISKKDQVIVAFLDILTNCDLIQNLTKLGLNKRNIAEYVNKVKGNLLNDPAQPNLDHVRKVVVDAFG